MRPAVLLLNLLPFLAAAQHCGYCFSGLIAVHAHTSDSEELVPDLRITLLDSTGLPATHHGGLPYGDFTRNSERPANWESRRLWVQHGSLRFPFAGDTYVLVVPLDLVREGWSVLVQDLNDEVVWPRYRQKVVPLKSFDSHPLCGRSEDEVYEPRPGHPVFAPLDIILERR